MVVTYRGYFDVSTTARRGLEKEVKRQVVCLDDQWYGEKHQTDS